MKQLLEPGKYVVAVSGGVDSVVLLHMLRQDPSLELVVAHFDHGIRSDSHEDVEFVSRLAGELPFFTKRVELGPDASEAEARKQRYEFLRDVVKQTDADAIVTAHHQDDLIETALLNILRGTKRRGLVSLKSTNSIKRPLLHVTKDEIRAYATKHKLAWREDSTNADPRYRRNQIRQLIRKSLNPTRRQELLGVLQQIEQQNLEIDQIISDYIEDTLDRKQLNKLGLSEAYEMAASWLRYHHVPFDKNTIQRLVVGSRILNPQSQIDLQQNFFAKLSRDKIILMRR